MTEGWLVEVHLRDEEDEDPLVRIYAAHIRDVEEAEKSVAQYIQFEDREDAADRKRAKAPKAAETQVLNVEAVGEISENGLSYLALVPGSIARWS